MSTGDVTQEAPMMNDRIMLAHHSEFNYECLFNSSSISKLVYVEEVLCRSVGYFVQLLKERYITENVLTICPNKL